MGTTRRCDNCAYFQKIDGDTGQCRYMPPQLDSKNQSQARPVVGGNNWCGRFSESSVYVSSGLEVVRRYLARQLLPLQEQFASEEVDVSAMRQHYMALCASIAVDRSIADLIDRDDAVENVYESARAYVGGMKRVPKKAQPLFALVAKVAELDGGGE